MNHTISAILRGAWLIDRDYAQSHLPLVLGILQGKLSGSEFFSGNGPSEKPFIINTKNKRVEMYVWNWSEERYELNEKAIEPGSVAVIPVIGPVTKYNGSCGEAGMVKRQAWTNELVSLPNIEGLISFLDTPGGQADGTPQYTDYVASIEKMTIALVEGGAYSAGAWIASGHNKIYAANKHAKFGSIGAYTTIMDFRGYFEKAGVKVKEFYPAISKDKNKSFRDAIDGDSKLILEEITALAQSFIDSFHDNRQGRLTSDEWNTGKVFNSADSIRIGLIDGIKNLNEVASEIRGTKIHAPSSGSSSHTSLNSNNTDMKFENLAALAANSTPTVEQIDLANADLTTEGITGVTLVAESFINEAASVTSENERLTSELASANTSLESAARQ